MKKKFLALALAAAVMAPTTSAFAQTTVTKDEAKNSQTIAGKDDFTHEAEMQIEGIVQKNDGTAPEGRIEVELPLKTSFTVDKDGKFTGSNFKISNKGGSEVNVTVASFAEGEVNGGITIDKTLSEGNKNEKHRNVVKLTLEAVQGQTSNQFDLDKTISNQDLVDIPAGDSATVYLTGIAGTKKNGDSGTPEVETKGASEEFTLTFKIAKKA